MITPTPAGLTAMPIVSYPLDPAPWETTWTDHVPFHSAYRTSPPHRAYPIRGRPSASRERETAENVFTSTVSLVQLVPLKVAYFNPVGAMYPICGTSFASRRRLIWPCVAPDAGVSTTVRDQPGPFPDAYMRSRDLGS